MTKVIYDSDVVGEAFYTIGEGTYFDYQGSLYLLADECRDTVFDFKNGTSFIWGEKFDDDTYVLPISSDRITIKVD